MAIIAGPSVLHRAIAYSGSSHNWVENFPKQNLSVRSPAISTFECLKAASAALRCWDVKQWKRSGKGQTIRKETFSHGTIISSFHRMVSGIGKFLGKSRGYRLEKRNGKLFPFTFLEKINFGIACCYHESTCWLLQVIAECGLLIP